MALGLFKKKGEKEAAKPLPIDKIKAMSRMGMSERDVIRQLKTEGYSFSEIEKAMMSALKEGVGEVPGAIMGEAQLSAPSAIQKPVPSPARTAMPMQIPQPMLEEFEPEAYEQVGEELAPEIIMEELIESVAEEKFESFTKELGKLDEEIQRFRVEILKMQEKFEEKPKVELPKELDEKLGELETRLGGLEKAFNQLVPAIKDSIENLSKTVKEFKEKQPQPINPSQTPGYPRYPTR